MRHVVYFQLMEWSCVLNLNEELKPADTEHSVYVMLSHKRLKGLINNPENESIGSLWLLYFIDHSQIQGTLW